MYLNKCPSDCSGNSVGRQRRLDETVKSEINSSWTDNALRCFYCGCVHVDGEIKGYYSAPMGTEGWVPK
jgi:hypothetical protein